MPDVSGQIFAKPPDPAMHAGPLLHSLVSAASSCCCCIIMISIPTFHQHPLSMQMVSMCPSSRVVDGLALPRILPSPLNMRGIRGILSALYLPISRCFITYECHGPKLCLPHTRLPASPTRPADHAS